MASEFSVREFEKAKRAFRAKMAQIGLQHLTGVDARTGAILKRSGLLKHSRPTEELKPQAVARIVADATHPRRIALSEGPLVAVRQDKVHDDKVHCYVVPVVVLLLADSVKVRRAALMHLDRLDTQTYFTPKTAHVLAANRETLCRHDSNAWSFSAIQMHDAIKDDVLCNLAALKQSGELGFDEGVSEYLLSVMRPSVSSLDSISLAVWNPAQQRAQVEEIIAASLGRASSMREAMSCYYLKLGHLPLASGLGMGEVVRQWLRLKGTSPNCWGEIWEWANSCSSPLARYHACAALIENPIAVPEHSRCDLWREILNVVHQPGDEDFELQWTQAWRLRCELARHYYRHLECRVPRAESERLAGLSWWLAERLAVLIGNSDQRIRRFRAETVRAESAISDQVWHLARPVVVPSSLRYATAGNLSVWALSLLCQLRSSLEALNPRDLSPEDQERIDLALRTHVIGTFPVCGVSDHEATYAFDQTVLSTASAWVESCGGDPSREPLPAFVAAVRRIVEPAELVAAIGRFPTLSQADQVLVAHVLNVMAYLGQAPSDEIWDRLVTDDWRNELLLNAPEQSLEILFDALREIQLQKNDKWTWDLPHMFASAAETVSNGPERLRVLFAMAVLSSLNADNVSAVQRLLVGRHRGALSGEVKYWRERLEEIWDFAPAWIVARLRAMMAALSVGTQ